MKTKFLSLNDTELLEKIGDAFSSSIRIKILSILCEKSISAGELREILNLSKSTVSFHLKVLREAQLIKELPSPERKGNEKNISLAFNSIGINFFTHFPDDLKTLFIDIPIGSYSKYDIKPPCAILSKEKVIGEEDLDELFSIQDHIKAELLSFSKGFIEYTSLIKEVINKEIHSIEYSLEICSECPYYNNNRKSDISFMINNKFIGTYRSLGDYGGRKGKYTPDWRPVQGTQYGKMVSIRVTTNGSYINDKKVSPLTINDILLDKYLTFTIKVDENSHYVGGVNIFGQNFGDYNQNILLKILYKDN